MAVNNRRNRKGHEPSISNKSYESVDDVRNTTKSREQMKKDWGSKRNTMQSKLAK